MTKRYKVIRDDGEYSSYWDTLEEAQKCVDNSGWINHYDIIIDTLTGKKI
jgi:hypothetical protein